MFYVSKNFSEIWYINIGENKDFYEKSFFSPTFLQQKFWKIFGYVKLGEKKDVYIKIFFFTKIHAIPEKFFIPDIKLGEKKDFYIIIFFSPTFVSQMKNFLGIAWILVKKKISI